MAAIKSLIKETAIYGLSSIIGRFLNWCLVPLYVYIFPTEEYGIVSYLYSFTAVALVILNYGMETGFFRFANKEENPEKVYTTSLISVGTTSLLFILIATLFITPISETLKLPNNGIYVWLLAVIVAIDAFTNIPFAYLRFKKKAFRFAGIKMLNVALNISLNLFFLLACPKLMQTIPALIEWFYTPLGGQALGIGWIFIANLISTIVILLMLIPELIGKKYAFDITLLKKMLSYSWPLLILGIAGIMSQNMGQMIIPFLFDNQTQAQSMVGIYGANIKIAIVMVMFTQAFRYAYEPFIFAQAKNRGEQQTKAYGDAMKFFIIFGLMIFLGVMFFLPTLKHFVSEAYWPGLKIVPIMMLAELFFGVFFNLSLWYKLTDRTRWGMYFSLMGFAIMLGLNLWFVPQIGIPDGYVGSAWAAFISYFIMMVVSYLIGKKYYPIPYQIRRIAIYCLTAGVLFFIGYYLCDFTHKMWLTYTLRSLILATYILIIAYNEPIPVLSRMIKKATNSKKQTP